MRKVRRNDPKRPVTLKTVAQYVGLAPGTVSAVLTEGPGSRKIPQRTKDRIVQAAAKLNYYPNPFARALRTNPKAIPNISSSVDCGPGTLIFVGAEHCARAIQAIRNAGLSVPGDVAIVSVQNFSAELDRLAS